MVEQETYAKAIRLAEALRADLDKRLRQALKDLGDPFLVRAQIEPSRTKEQASLERKADEKGWTLKQAITEAWDFIGFRIVCNNLQDVERAAQVIQEKLEGDGLIVRRRDYVNKPRSSGYRAIHLLVQIPVALGSESMTLGCEVQIRTFLQDAWGRLSRADIYQSQVPKSLSDKAKRLAEVLARADRLAEEIRQQVIRPRRGHRKPAAGAPLTRPAIAFVYRRAFGEDPPGYLVESTLQDYGKTPIRADGLDDVLQDSELLGRLENAYSEHTRWGPQREQVFRWAVDAAAHGTAPALALARREGREDWSEIDAQYKREISSEIPESWEDVEERLAHPHKDDDPYSDVHLWADYFDAASECGYCSAKLVEVDDLAWRMVKRFKLRGEKADEAYDNLRTLLVHSGVDDSEGTRVCNYCHYKLNKDD